MTEQGTVTGELVRVGITHGARRTDLALPGAVPVVELLPGVARELGALDPQRVHAGYRLVASDGRVLAGSAGLSAQSVDDGAVLTLQAAADDDPPRVYDDIVEAMSDAVEQDMTPWNPASSRRTALGAAALLLLVGAGALITHAGVLAAVTTGVVGVLLVVAGIVLSQLRDEDEVALVLCLTGSVYLATAGATALTGFERWGLPVVLSGTGLTVGGIVGAIGLSRLRNVMLAGIILGLALAATGGVVAVTDFTPGQVAAVLLPVIVLATFLAAPLVLGSTRSQVPVLYSHNDITAEPDDIDVTRVRKDASGAHDALLGISLAVGLLTVMLAPFLVQRGVTGALLAVCASVVVMTRTRQYRVGREVGVGLILGVLALAATCVAAVVEQPGWRAMLGLLLALAGALMLAATLPPASTSVRRSRNVEILEIVMLVAMIPLAVFACGLVAAVTS